MWKLLKYDLKSIFKVWWIASLAVLGTSAAGGLCLRMLADGRFLESDSGGFADVAVSMSGVLGIIFAYIALIAYMLIITFFILRRFYRHFFTDEGYLTFTLPVKRTQLLTAKLLMGFGYNLITLLVTAVCVGVFLVVGLVGVPGVDVTEGMKIVGDALAELSGWCGGFLPLYLLEGVLLLIAQSLFGTLYAYLCITIGCIVAKRQKVLASIGIYYGGTVVLSFVSQILFILLVEIAFPSMEPLLETGSGLGLFAVMLLVLLVVIAALAVLCYCLILRLLKRRLNLA